MYDNHFYFQISNLKICSHEFRYSRASQVLTDRRAVAFKQRRARPQNPQVLAPLSDDSTWDSSAEDDSQAEDEMNGEENAEQN